MSETGANSTPIVNRDWGIGPKRRINFFSTFHALYRVVQKFAYGFYVYIEAWNDVQIDKDRYVVKECIRDEVTRIRLKFERRNIREL